MLRSHHEFFLIAAEEPKFNFDSAASSESASDSDDGTAFRLDKIAFGVGRRGARAHDERRSAIDSIEMRTMR